MKSFFNRIIFAAVLLVFFLPVKSNAQFDVGAHYAGPSLGFYFHGSSIILGGNYEYGMELKDIGKVGIGGIVRYFSYDAGWWSYSDILLAAQGNYHFNLESKKFDPWAGLVIGFDIGSVDYSGPGNQYYVEPSYGGFLIGLQGGARYWFSPSMAVVGRLGFGSLSFGYFDVGLDFKL